MLQDRLGKQHLVISFIFVRVYYWTTVEWKELLPGSTLSHLDYGSRIHDLSLVSGFCIVAFTISMVLLPCAVSSTWTWVNQLHALVQWLGWDRTTTYRYFKTLCYLGQLCGICYDIAKQYWAACGLFFWKRSVSPSSLGVFLGFLFCFWWWLLVLFVGFVLEDTWLLLSPILQHVGIVSQKQYVLMTVWASSAHGMSSKKTAKAYYRVPVSWRAQALCMFFPAKIFCRGLDCVQRCN